MKKLYKVFQLYYRLAFDPDSYFLHYGFLRTIKLDRPYDKNGDPLPWMNYAILDFFEEKLNKNQTLFEYGLGFSTLYFSKRVKSVNSVEHDKTWFEDINASLRDNDNVKIELVELENGYEKAVANTGNKYDIILVDGRNRVQCAINALDSLSDNGVLILDDSQRPKYQGAFDFYEEKGFRKLTFTGLKPSGFRRYASTIFYRAGNNCMDI